jgi:hypothetical protein
MNKFLGRLLIIFTIISIFLMGFGWIQESVYRNGDYYKSQWINTHKNEKYEVVIIGNSRASQLKINNVSYLNLAEDGLGMKITYLQLYQFFKNCNKASEVFLEGDASSLRKLDETRRSPRWLPFFNDSVVFNALKYEHKLFKYHKAFPAVNYLIFKYDWGIPALLNNVFSLRPSPWGEYGYFYTCDSYIDSELKGSTDFISYPPNWKWINKIKELCELNNSQLTIFTAPNYYMKDTINDTKYFTIELLKLGINYKDYSRIYYPEQSFFRDNRHLNCIGVEKFSIQLQKLVLSSND